MTLAQIMKLALRQLDEDVEDISEYDDLFRAYANEAYAIAVDQYVKPRQEIEMTSDEKGEIDLTLTPQVRRVVSLKKVIGSGLETRYMNVEALLAEHGRRLRTRARNSTFLAVCECEIPELIKETDEPQIPQKAHAALADYICYRHLANGNMAKQSRAQHYLQSFYQAMNRLRPDGFGSVTVFHNLYTATDIRNGGGW